MSEPQVESGAFRQALLKSEQLRIRIAVGSLGVVFMVQTIGALIVPNRADLHFWLWKESYFVPIDRRQSKCRYPAPPRPLRLSHFSRGNVV